LLSRAASGRAEFDRVITVAAGEAAKRSERALGHGGLAQRRGHRTVIQLVQSLTGESKGEAARQVKVGELIGETDAAQRTITDSGTGSPGDTSTDGGDIETSVGDNAGTDVSGHGENDADQMPAPELAVPWQYPVTAAIMTGTLSAENGHLILRTLDGVSETCSAEVRRAAATELVDYATGQQGLGATLHEDLLRRARQVRDRIDPDGIQERYTARYERRSLRTWHDRDGALNLHAVCDDDSGVFLTQLFDLALSPRRGGPRFTAKDDVAWAQRLLDDPRSNEQLAFDTLLAVLHDGAACDQNTTFRGDRPAVRVITVINTNDTDTTDTDTTDTAVTDTAATGTDRGVEQHGQLEGSAFALPHTVVEATVCTDGVVPITVDRSGRALNLGRTRRLFSPAQRVILRARDGGCLWPGCTDHPGKPKPTTSTTTPNTTAKPTSPTASACANSTTSTCTTTTGTSDAAAPTTNSSRRPG
ncbi:DUF222 domain-containing protein, partial [Humibacter sp.]|uniref:DUF222 domain-containing protein n=1 Tax=Humibacter sp. TaxID=1940291 RepID=UPI003F7E29C3